MQRMGILFTDVTAESVKGYFLTFTQEGQVAVVSGSAFSTTPAGLSATLTTNLATAFPDNEPEEEE